MTMGKFENREKTSGEGTCENNSFTDLSAKGISKNKKQMKNLPYFSDPLLIPRINQYLSENKDKVYIDIHEMVHSLQSRYREYGRRKKNVFRQSVRKAFSAVLQQCGVSQGLSEQSDDYIRSTDNSSSEVEECNIGDSEENFKSTSNSQVMNLYKSKPIIPKNLQKNDNDNAELIDLSSDDENYKIKDQGKEKVADIEKNSLTENCCNVKEVPSVPPSKISSETVIPDKIPSLARKRKLESNSYKFRSSLSKEGTNYPAESKVTFSDFGGNKKALEEVCKLILHIQHPEFYRQIGITSPRGFLLHGPPGCGKTLLATAIAGELGVHFLKVSAPELVGGVSGESEERIRKLFISAVECAPCVLFIDEVDAITPNRQNAQREMERRIVAQLLTCLDELDNAPNGDQVLVIGATNRPDSLDPALRRAGRFDREVCLGIPDLMGREQILKIVCKNLKLCPNFSFEEVALNTPGFVGADLLALTREATMAAVNRVFGALYRNNQGKACKRKKMKLDVSDKKYLKSGKVSRGCIGRAKNESKSVDTCEVPSENDQLDVCNGHQRAGEQVNPIVNKEQSVAKKNGTEDIDVHKENTDDFFCGNINDKESDSRHFDSHYNVDREKDTCSVNDLVDMEITDTVSEESVNCDTHEIEIFKEGSVNTVDSDDEPGIEEPQVNQDSSEPPHLETLLSWIRCTPPLTSNELENVYLTQDDFKKALRCVQPSAKREGFATVPDVTWDDVGSLSDIREELKMSILGPVKMRKQFEQLGLTAPSGILICGPPGCGKTLLAKAVANEAGINFISVKGPELLNMYVGESERAVRQCFQRARNSSPCVIFFDELDALCPKRSNQGENGASMRVVNQMLTEMDGVEARKEVYIMAATNRPDIVDPAVLRPGRLDKVLYVGLPEEEGRTDILRALTKNGTRPKLAADVVLADIAKRPECIGYSGADLAALVREAGIQALKDLIVRSEVNTESEVYVSLEHFERALSLVRPSVSIEDRKHYESLKKRYCTSSRT